ncbi:MAG: hypothetical protein WBN57_11895, partial [Gammaproteobacteria bacterium]
MKATLYIFRGFHTVWGGYLPFLARLSPIVATPDEDWSRPETVIPWNSASNRESRNPGRSRL